MKTRALLCTALVAGLSLLSAGGSARAAMMLQVVSSGGPGVVVTDNVPPDLDPALGSIVSLYHDSIFTSVTSVGTSKPQLGFPGHDEMDLNNFSIAASGPGTLTIML